MNNGFYGHSVGCLCVLCQYTHRGIRQASQEQLNQLYALQGIQQQFSHQPWPDIYKTACGGWPPNRPKPTPGDVDHMKQAEPVDDEPVAQIEWKHPLRDTFLRTFWHLITGK